MRSSGVPSPYSAGLRGGISIVNVAGERIYEGGTETGEICLLPCLLNECRGSRANHAVLILWGVSHTTVDLTL